MLEGIFQIKQYKFVSQHIYIYLYELKYLRNIVNYLAFNIQND